MHSNNKKKRRSAPLSRCVCRSQFHKEEVKSAIVWGLFFVVVFVMNQDVEHEKEQLKINTIVIVKVLVKLKKRSNALNNWACGLIS